MTNGRAEVVAQLTDAIDLNINLLDRMLEEAKWRGPFAQVN